MIYVCRGMLLYRFVNVLRKHQALGSCSFLPQSVKKNFISSMNPEISTIVFFDIETTGIPHMEWGRTRITELSMCAVRTLDLQRAYAFRMPPRVINKVNLCLNPQKALDPKASEITGLTNELLEYYGAFDERIVNIIENFLLHLPTPVCLVSHNGDRFDFPILADELKHIGKSLPDHLLSGDSLKCFREMYKVPQARKRLFTNGRPSAPTTNGEISGIQRLPAQNTAAGTTASLVSMEMDVVQQLPMGQVSHTATTSSVSVSGTVSVTDTVSVTTVQSLHLDAMDDEWDAELVQIAEQVENQHLSRTPPNQNIPELHTPPPMRVVHREPVRDMSNASMQEINETTPERPIVANGKPKSFKLVDIYTHLTQSPVPPNLHCAEADALALMQCFACSAPQALPWLKKNAVPFTKFM